MTGLPVVKLCPRCKGEEYVEVGDIMAICPTCKGTGDVLEFPSEPEFIDRTGMRKDRETRPTPEDRP